MSAEIEILVFGYCWGDAFWVAGVAWFARFLGVDCVDVRESRGEEEEMHLYELLRMQLEEMEGHAVGFNYLWRRASDIL